MWGTFFLGLVTLSASAAPAPPARDELVESIELGSLEGHFKLIAAELHANGAGVPHTVVLKLEAKRAVDTSRLHVKGGFFDKDNHLYAVVPLMFKQNFPLERGESIRAELYWHDLKSWKRIALREVEKPVGQDTPRRP